jgi:hypothetical protein
MVFLKLHALKFQHNIACKNTLYNTDLLNSKCQNYHTYTHQYDVIFLK